MQYLLKINLQSAAIWRLVALDGSCSLAQCAEIIARAFAYAPGERSFNLGAVPYPAGKNGIAAAPAELQPFDTLSLQEGMAFEYRPYASGFVHQGVVMRCEEHLYCLMPSCLVGAGLVPPALAADEAALARYQDAEEAQSLDLRACNRSIRAYAETLQKKQELAVNFVHC